MANPDPRKHEEFDRWALPHMDQVYSAALYLTRNQEGAEELLQETFLRAYRFWHQFAPGTNCKAWLMTILHNNFKNRYRDRYRDQHTVEFDESLNGLDSSVDSDESRMSPEDMVLSRLLDSEVEQALKSLPTEFLETVVLVDVHELTYEEAATALGCPVGTIRSRLARGRRLLHSALRQYAMQRGYIGRGKHARR